MDSAFYSSQYGNTEDYLTEEMFTSQPQEFPTAMATTGANMGPMTSMDSIDMRMALGLSTGISSSPDPAFPPALTPSNDSDISAASDHLTNWFESTNAPQDPPTFDLAPTIVSQGPSAFPIVSQFDSPLSMPSSYGETFPHDMDSQMSYLEMPQPAYDPGMTGFSVAPPATLASPTYMEQAYSVDQANPMPLSSMDEMARRMSNESGPRMARSDERYSYLPAADGLYYCPFDGCSHSPDKLKCNYDKHLDAHLRPYRCKIAACAAVPFSSTACVLRHEREAHGMHGHGTKPFVCLFPDCERSQPTNGFPRKWNLGDHMKRVHGYTAATLEKSNGLSTPPPDSPELHVPGPLRIKRANRSNPKASSKKATRSSVPQAQVDEQTTVLAPRPDMHQDYSHYLSSSWDPSQLSSSAFQWTQ